MSGINEGLTNVEENEYTLKGYLNELYRDRLNKLITHNETISSLASDIADSIYDAYVAGAKGEELKYW